MSTKNDSQRSLIKLHIFECCTFFFLHYYNFRKTCLNFEHLCLANIILSISNQRNVCKVQMKYQTFNKYQTLNIFKYIEEQNLTDRNRYYVNCQCFLSSPLLSKLERKLKQYYFSNASTRKNCNLKIKIE